MGGLLPHHLILSVSPFDGIYGTAHLGIKLLTQLVPDLLPVWGNLGKHQESLQGSLQELSSRLFCQMLATLQIKPRALYISECVCQNPVTSCVSLGLCPPSLPPSLPTSSQTSRSSLHLPLGPHGPARRGFHSAEPASGTIHSKIPFPRGQNRGS